MISVGGIGGSGTRLIASILESLGYFMGNDLNNAKDYLLFAFLFRYENTLFLTEKELTVRIKLFLQVINRQEILTNTQIDILKSFIENKKKFKKEIWLKKRFNRAISFKKEEDTDLVGWKAPNTHIVIENFFHHLDNLKFIYLYRNGLDMAYSKNQNQLKIWGNILLNNDELEINPTNSLRYWCETHKRMIKLHTKYPKRVLLLNFDALCQFPDEQLNKLLSFLNMNIDENKKELIKSLINIPESIGRYKQHPLSQFNENDLSYCKHQMKM